LGLSYLKPYAGTGFSRRARAPLGVVCGKPRGYWVWFSEPPNKELCLYEGKMSLEDYHSRDHGMSHT
jgi:hypothetical protein